MPCPVCRAFSPPATFRPSSRPVVVVAAGVLSRTIRTGSFRKRGCARGCRRAQPDTSSLESSVNGNIQLVRGLIATIETEPEHAAAALRRARTQRLQRRLAASQHRRRARTGVAMVYPLTGNERRSSRLPRERQTTQFRHARMASGEMVLAACRPRARRRG